MGWKNQPSSLHKTTNKCSVKGYVNDKLISNTHYCWTPINNTTNQLHTVLCSVVWSVSQHSVTEFKLAGWHFQQS